MKVKEIIKLIDKNINLSIDGNKDKYLSNEILNADIVSIDIKTNNKSESKLHELNYSFEIGV